MLANADGVVDMTPQAIAARTSFPLDMLLRGIKFLESPDPYSRTPGDNGKRIVLIDPENRPWGWEIVNHGKYKGIRDMAQKREADRIRISDKRNKNKDVAITSRVVANVAHADAYADTDTESREHKRSHGSRLPSEWFPSTELVGWSTKERPDLDIATVIAKFRDHWKAKPGKAGTKLDWDATFRNWVRDEKPGRKTQAQTGEVI